MTLLVTSTQIQAKERLFTKNLMHKLHCTKIGLYDPKSGRCFLGPNDKVVTEMIELERRLKPLATAPGLLWKWNHGRDKKEIRGTLRP